jgi:CDP-glucose 4,6-dehydratase
MPMSGTSVNPAFWRDKRVLITGHTGFKGSWLCLLLNALGARVAGFAMDPPTQPNLFSLARVDELVDSTIGDVRDLIALAAKVRSFEPHVVLHMAAQSVVLQSYEDPIETYATNVIGTATTLEAIRRAKQPCTIVNVTTDKVYENCNWVWGYRETDALGGRDPYSNSKACAELVARSYRDSFFPLSSWPEHQVALASARAGNVIGGGDWTSRQLIPDAIAAFQQGRPIVLRHPDAIRPWQHVLDCLAGYMTLAQALAADAHKYSGEWNFGPGESDARPVSYVVESLGAHWDVKPVWTQDAVKHAHEERQLKLDASKAATELAWRCQLTFDEALRWVASWYRRFHGGADARELCREQIQEYFAGRVGA